MKQAKKISFKLDVETVVHQVMAYRNRKRDSRDRDRDRDQDRDHVVRDRERRKRSRSRSPDRRRRHSRSPDPRRPSRSQSPHRNQRHRKYSSSPEKHLRRKRQREESVDVSTEKKISSGGGRDVVAKKKTERNKSKSERVEVVEEELIGAKVDIDEVEMMKKMGIPVGFDSTKGKPVEGADVSGIRTVTKRQPRQYMNRRGGFNRPLPPETNRR